MTTLTYNDINPFEGLSPTPFVGRQVEMVQFGDRWAERETFTLKGQLTGVCYPDGEGRILTEDGFGILIENGGDLLCEINGERRTFQSLVDKQTTLISRFGQDFQTFQIKDDADVVFERPFIQVTNISFDASNYAYTVPYVITLQAYPEEYFEGTFGVTDPKEEINYSDSRDGIISISHNISAKGINTSSGESNALDNARTWVQSREGFSSQVLPIFVNYQGSTPCLTTKSETVNRLAGIHELRETYTTDSLLGGYGLLRYTVDYNYRFEDGVSTVEVKGDIVGCKNGTMEQVRARFQDFDPYAEAVNNFFRITGRFDLNPTPITKGISEDPTHVRLGFSFLFNDDLAPATHFDYKVSFDYDIEADIITAAIEGTVKSNVELSIRWAAVQNYANQIDLFSLLLPLYEAYADSIGVDYLLNPTPFSYSRTENSFTYEISLSASYNNSLISPEGLSQWEYNIQIEPALRQYKPVACMNGLGSYVVFDLGFSTRKKLRIQGSAIGQPTSSQNEVVAVLKTESFILQNRYLGGTRQSLDGQSITTSNAAFELSAAVSSAYSSEDFQFTL